MKPTPGIQFLSVCILLALLSTATQSAFAQAGAAALDPPLNFANNYFIRGDYTVAGAQGMTSTFTTIGGIQYAVGTITVPDTNPGIKPSGLKDTVSGQNIAGGTNQVPPGAEVIAAVLYWQTVEKVGVAPGQPGSGEVGFFRPVVSGGPAAPGYVITGVPLSSGGTNTVSWSAGGCTSGSTGKVIRTYRANVLGVLPRDGSGNVLANNKYEVRLAGTSSTTPIAVGASLVLIYRILNPNVPLNSIVIYDGDYAPSASSLIMNQSMQGFYDAAHNPVSRLTYIVGNGKAKKSETVYLNSVSLPSLYPNGQPPFPGYYGTWDNPTWTFDPNKTYVNLLNPVTEDSASVSTQVTPGSSQQGCVSWGAQIVSTTVKNTDGDGLLDAWKKAPAGYANPGYCDAAVNEGVCAPGSASWVDLPGATPGQKDVFIQLDYMCSKVTGVNSCTTGDGINYSFDPTLQIDPSDSQNAIQKVVAAYGAKGITLHVNPAGTNQPNVHSILEPGCQDITTTNPPSLCTFPNAPGTTANMGVVAWAGGFFGLKDQLIDPTDFTGLNSACTTSPPAPQCVPRFQPAAAPSKHYVVFAHAVGQPKWKIGGTLTSVQQAANSKVVTFTTSTPVGALNIIGTDGSKNSIFDPYCPNGRVTVVGVATNVNLDGTFCVNSFDPQGTSFSINVGGTPPTKTTNYTLASDPNLVVVPGFTGTASGVSDVVGANSMITLGLWGNPASPTSDGQKATTIAGAFMHEFGHANGLAHGGPAAYVAQGKQTLQSVLTNCKANYLSSMSYSRQLGLLPDYSASPLPDLNEITQTGSLSGSGSSPTAWYVPWPAAFDNNGNPIGSAAKTRCDGTATNGVNMILHTDLTSNFSWNSINPSLPPNPDINFDGNLTILHGADDWHNLDLAQLDGTGVNSSSSGPQFNGGGPQFNGGGPQFNGGGKQFNGGGPQFNGGGPQFNGGGPQFNGGGEIDNATANAITYPPQNLTATEGASARLITLNWTAPVFGQIGAYNVYRSKNGGAFTIINAANTNPPHTVVGNPPGTTYTDTVSCDAGGYRYFVTAVLSDASVNPGQESAPGNTVSTTAGGALLTGCYTNTPPTVSLNSPIVNGGTSTVTQGPPPVPVTWSLQDDDTSAYVTRLQANSVKLYGPINNDTSCGPVTNTTPVTQLLTNGVVNPSYRGTTFGVSGNVFTLNWDDTAFPAGCYVFEVDLDSGQSATSSTLTVFIFVSNNGPYVTTTSLPKAIAGVPYSTTIQQAGGVGPTFTWSVISGATPPGITVAGSGDPNTGADTVSGTATDVGTYNFTVKVTDTNGNYGTQALSLLVVAPVALINQPVAPEILLLGGAAPVLTVNGEGFYAGSQVWWNGSALPTTFVNTGQLTATVPAGDVTSLGTASISVANKNSPNSNVDFFQVSDPITAVSLSRTDDSTGASPITIVAADFGNGKQDLAIANYGANTVSILLGNGDGTFTAQTPLNTGSGPYSLTAGDFNKDGKLDLAVANFGDNTVSIFLGNGDGTFTPATTPTVGVGTAPVSVIAADFDRDGKLDLAVANQNDHAISILLGNGDGTFRAKVDYQAGTTDVAGLAVGDFNGDNKLDLAVTNPSSDTISVLLGNGDGTFAVPAPYSTGNPQDHPVAVTALDVNGDGKLDLAVTNLNGKTVAILKGNGNGTFQTKLTFPTTSGAYIGPDAIATGDFNADGIVDLAITNQEDNTVAILLGNGDGTFQNPKETITSNDPLGVAAGPVGVAAGDFIGNGRLDLAVADYSDNKVSIMLQRPQPPTNLATGAVTASQVPLTWTASVSTTVVGYNVYRGTVSGGPYTKVNLSLVNGTSYTDTTVASGTTYYYVVTAVDPNNLESVTSLAMSTMTPPLPATALTASAVPAGQVTLNWTASTTGSVSGYNVYRSTSSGTGYAKIAGPVPGTTYQDLSVTSGQTYYYVVTAVGPGNVESVYSNEVSATP